MISKRIVQQLMDVCLWRRMDFSISGTCELAKGKCNMSFCRHKIIRMLSFFVALILGASFLAGCSTTNDDYFPKVTQPKATDSAISAGTTPAPSVTPEALPSGTTVLKVAAPFSNMTAQYLAKLYTAKETGDWSSQESGSTVTLERLDTVKPAFNVEIIQTPSTGATQNTIEQWKKNGFVPDIIYTDTLASLKENKAILPLSEYAASNPLFLATRLYMPMLESCSIDDELYGIPYSAAAEILYVNMNLLNEAGINAVPFNLDLDAMTAMSESVRNMTPEGTPLNKQNFAFYKPSELISFLPSSFSDTADWFMFDGKSFDFTASSFTSAINYLRSYVSAGYSVEGLTSQDQREAFTSLDPRLSTRVAMWAGSSAEVTRWSINHAYALSIAQIPAADSETDSRLALTVYPLCVSSASQAPQLACDFASFIALDEDAILLSARLENLDGLLPVVSSTTVWESVCLQQTFGEELLLLQDKVPDAYYNPVTNHKSEYMLAQQLLNEYRTSLLDETQDLQVLISSLTNAGLTS